jgi:glycosyltransferase involved in cell wall biosynthesis
MTPTITVAILSLNRPEYLVQMIESILTQTLTPDKIVIYDNGSNVNVWSAVRKYVDFDKVVFIGSEKTYNAQWNFERVVRSTDTDFLCVVHDDDILYPNFIKEQYKMLCNCPEIAASACNGDMVNTDLLSLNRTLGPNRYVYLTSRDEVAMFYAKGTCLPFPSMMYRTKHIQKIKPIEELGIVADAGIMCDLIKYGAIIYNSKSLFQYRVHPDQESKEITRSQLRILEEHLFNNTENTQLKKTICLLSTRRTIFEIIKVYKENSKFFQFMYAIPCLLSFIPCVKKFINRRLWKIQY